MSGFNYLSTLTCFCKTSTLSTISLLFCLKYGLMNLSAFAWNVNVYYIYALVIVGLKTSAITCSQTWYFIFVLGKNFKDNATNYFCNPIVISVITFVNFRGWTQTKSITDTSTYIKTTLINWLKQIRKCYVMWTFHEFINMKIVIVRDIEYCT